MTTRHGLIWWLKLKISGLFIIIKPIHYTFSFLYTICKLDKVKVWEIIDFNFIYKPDRSGVVNRIVETMTKSNEM